MELLVIFLLGALELWLAVPAGLAMDVNNVLTGVTAVLGAVTGAWLFSSVGEKLREWVELKTGFDMFSSSKGILYKVWIKYGVVGLGLLAPLLTGAPIGAVLGVAFGAQRKRMFFWVSVGTIIWGVIITAAFTFGWSLFTGD